MYPFIHNPLHWVINDVSHRVPVYAPTQRQINQVFVVFQEVWQIPWFTHGDDKHGLAKIDQI